MATLEEAFKSTLLGQMSLEKRFAMRNVFIVLGTTIFLGFIGGRIFRIAYWAFKVNKIPGPSIFRTLKIIMDIIIYKKDAFKEIKKSIQKYSPISCTWLGPKVVIHVNKPEFAQEVLASTKNNHKAFNYNFLFPWLGQGLLIGGGERWHVHRRLITPTFHGKVLEEFSEVFNTKAQVLLGKLKKHCDNGKAFDVYPYITLAALDIICETAMGVDIKAQDDKPSDYLKCVYQMTNYVWNRTIRLWLYSDRIYNMTSDGKKFNANLLTLHNFTRKVISERRKARSAKRALNDSAPGIKPQVAFLDMLLDIEEGGQGLSEEVIREEVDTFMFAGHDTTSAAISWVLYLLGSHQDKQDLVYEELKNIFKGDDRHITLSDASEMVYLDRVIKEALRLYPSVPILGRYITEEIKVGRYKVPAGVSLFIHVHQMHMNPKTFPDPETFNPDHFLPERVQQRHSLAYIPFSGGPRNCIGQSFAILMEKVVLTTILREFKVISVDKKEDMQVTCEVTLKAANGINIILQKRT